jgi:hypothetical protein
MWLWNRYAPFTVLSVIAALAALSISWQPESAEAGRPAGNQPALRGTIREAAGLAAPRCRNTVWPNVPRECLQRAEGKTLEPPVRQITY